MATTRAIFRSRLRYRLQDTESASYTYANAVVDAWVDAAIDEINREVPYLPDRGNLTGMNGVLYVFDLASIFSTKKFMRIHSIVPMIAGAAPLTVHPEGMTYINNLLANSNLIGGTPRHYVPNGNSIYLDAVPATTDVITVDMWVQATAMATDGATPAGILVSGWDRLILGMASVMAGEDIPTDLGTKLLNQYYSVIYGSGREIGQLEKFRNWALNDLGYQNDVAAASYSDLREGSAATARGSNDYTAPY
jgi:hypothetical protein